MASVLGEVLTATVTPFNADGAVDYDAYRQLCTFLADNGSDGVVVNGTTGEASTLSEDERVSLIRAALEAAAGYFVDADDRVQARAAFTTAVEVYTALGAAADAARLQAGARVLDIGCGRGLLLIAAARRCRYARTRPPPRLRRDCRTCTA